MYVFCYLRFILKNAQKILWNILGLLKLKPKILNPAIFVIELLEIFLDKTKTLSNFDLFVLIVIVNFNFQII